MLNPDWAFMNKLKEIDRKLGCKFNPHIERFVITYERPVGEPISIWTIKQADGSFRHPDQRDIDILLKYDQKRINLDERFTKNAKKMEEAKIIARKKRADNFRDMTKDDKIQLSRAFSRVDQGGSKAGKGYFKSIKNKPKGKVF